jgi:nicotinate-nucleotide pyrophosphorylase (carboxylating)
MSPAAMKTLITELRSRDAAHVSVRFEATGGLTLETAAAVAASGVDFMSVGGLTHSSPILDIAIDLH